MYTNIVLVLYFRKSTYHN